VAAALKKLGHEPAILERDSGVGERWATRYDRLRLHTIRRFSGLPYHDLPRERGRYVSKDAFAEDLRDYADRVGVDDPRPAVRGEAPGAHPGGGGQPLRERRQRRVSSRRRCASSAFS
jgi:cation diffusion facilitator CzcD-associated flavoprotein CzcO